MGDLWVGGSSPSKSFGSTITAISQRSGNKAFTISCRELWPGGPNSSSPGCEAGGSARTCRSRSLRQDRLSWVERRRPNRRASLAKPVVRMNASVSSEAIRQSSPSGYSKLHSQTHRVHIRSPISASTLSPSATRTRNRISSAARRKFCNPRHDESEGFLGREARLLSAFVEWRHVVWHTVGMPEEG